MLHAHLPQLISHLTAVGREGLNCIHAISRAFVIMLYRQESPQDILKVVLREAKKRRRRTQKRFPFVLIHYHIFKNAGTSFEWALEQAFGVTRVLHLDTPFHYGYISAREMRQAVRLNPAIKVIATHQAAPPAPRIQDREVITSILIRDPIARIRSIYAFERFQDTVHPGNLKAKNLDFRQYVEWRLETSARMFCNFQVHFCCRRRVAEIPNLDSSHLQQAIEALDGVDIVGTVERYDEWLALARAVLEDHVEGLSLPSGRHNVLTGERCLSKETIYQDLVRDLGETTARYLLEQNELDMSLYQVADALLTRRLAERRVHLSLRHAYFNASAEYESSTLSGYGKRGEDDLV
jgi:hypothetical protein